MTNLLDQLLGKHYIFEGFENQFAKVEPGGNVIRIGLKGAKGFAQSWLEPSHPFCLENSLNPINGWDIVVRSPTPNVMRVVFTQDSEIYTLTLTCTDPSAKPKPISIKWD